MFIKDEEKMKDFEVLSKEEFLASYSYLTEKEYRDTSITYVINLWEEGNLTDKLTLDKLLNLIELEYADLYEKIIDSDCVKNYKDCYTCIEWIKEECANNENDYDVWIYKDRNKGYFEHKLHGDANGGGLWFRDNMLIDYDGVYTLPKSVIKEIEALGYIVDNSFRE